MDSSNSFKTIISCFVKLNSDWLFESHLKKFSFSKPSQKIWELNPSVGFQTVPFLAFFSQFLTNYKKLHFVQLSSAKIIEILIGSAMIAMVINIITRASYKCCT